MFSGEFSYRIDEKGRVPIPPRFRRDLEGGVVLAPGMERCVTAYTTVGWEKLSETLTRAAMAPSKRRKLTRALFATAFPTELDGQGRVALPNTLRDYAAIKDDVVIAGANTYLEIWSREAWEEEKATSLKDAWQILESMEDRS